MSNETPTSPTTSLKPALSHSQGELPFAIVEGEPLTNPPEDLYIPPQALEIFLDTFEGPLDLLLYLIKRQNLEILDIPIAEVTKQYMEYVEMMRTIKLDLAAEYLVMAALLAEIKSRMLLPRHDEVEDEDDPRAELVRRLQEYERFKTAAEKIDDIPRENRDYWGSHIEAVCEEKEIPLPDIELHDILLAFKSILQRADMAVSHEIQRESLSVRERMSNVLAALKSDAFTEFSTLFMPEEGRMGVVVTLVAILELLKERLADIVQSEPYAPIYLQAAQQADE